jgi:hypothetical protein
MYVFENFLYVNQLGGLEVVDTTVWTKSWWAKRI